MPKSHRKIIRTKKNSPEKIVSIFATIFSLLLIALGLVTLVVIQKPIQESQDLRKAAFVEGGMVKVDVSQPTNPKAGQEISMDFSVNTQNVQTAGIQLVFDVMADTIDSVNVEVLSSSGLVAEYQEVEQISGGFKVGVFARPSSISSSFVTSSYVSFLRVTFTPQAEGEVSLIFHPENSKSNLFGVSPVQDELDIIENISIVVQPTETICTYSYSNWSSCQDGQQTRTVTSKNPETCTTPDPVLTQSCQEDEPCSITYSGWTYCSNSIQTREITNIEGDCSESDLENVVLSQSCDESGTGGVTVKSCNETCDSNAECPVDHLCFELDDGQERCRRANNVSSSSCALPPGSGINRTCNEYCADSSECASGYSCYWNRCRLPENPSSETCAQPDVTIVNSISQGCNQPCGSNADCGVNLRCYNNKCRLATNPASLTCSAYTKKTVTGYTSTAKGGDLSDQLGSTGSGSYEGTQYASPTPAVEAIDSQDVAKDQSALDAVTNNLKERGLSLPRNMILGGLGILALVIILLLLSKMGKSRRMPVTPKKVAPYQPSKQEQQKMTELQKKISALGTAEQTQQPEKQQPEKTETTTPVARVTSVIPPVTTPAVPPTQPTVPITAATPEPTAPAPAPTPAAEPPMTPKAKPIMRPQPAPIQKPVQQPPQPPVEKPTNPMLERLKQKGIQQPGTRAPEVQPEMPPRNRTTIFQQTNKEP